MDIRSLLITSAAALCLVWQGCDDASVEPGPFEYPIKLQVNGSSSNVALSWTEATVSTFEEYVVVRSIDPIPETKDPEVVGNQVIIARLDEIDATAFVDFSTPFEPKLYYKVFADIGERFLPSATVEVTQPLQLVEYRTDALEIDHDADEIIGFDRSLDVLFVYNYTEQKMKAQTQWGFNFPFIRTGQYNLRDELYAVDQSQSLLYVFDREDLGYIQQFSAPSGVVDFFYLNGLFFITFTNGNIQVRSRDNFQQLASRSTTNGNRVLHVLKNDAQEIEFVEIGFTTVIKYRWSSNTLLEIDRRSDISGTSQLTTAIHPDRSEFIINNAGRVIGSDLADRGSLGTGLQFHNTMTYSDDGSMVATIGFVGNNNALRFFTTEDNYPEVSNNQLNFTPVMMWSDNGQIYTSTVIFVSGGIRSVINTYDLPQ